jgi:beta-phosphoglucomutase
MRYENVIFDLDGVLVSTDEYHYQAWKKIADEEGIYFDRAINNRLRGVSRMASLEIILERAEKNYTQAEKEELAQRKNRYYQELLGNLTIEDTLKGVRETLAGLRKNAVHIAVGSSSKNTMRILTQVGLENAFDAIADGTEITHSKPNPEVFLLAAQKLGAKPENCLVVEDAPAGVQAGVNAGMQVAGIGEAAKVSQSAYALQEIRDLLNIAV